MIMAQVQKQDLLLSSRYDILMDSLVACEAFVCPSRVTCFEQYPRQPPVDKSFKQRKLQTWYEYVYCS
jgi:hypothetical protein